jgi:hypothetical protein
MFRSKTAFVNAIILKRIIFDAFALRIYFTDEFFSGNYLPLPEQIKKRGFGGLYNL